MTEPGLRLVQKTRDRTVADLAQETGATPADAHKRSLMVERAEKTAASMEETLMPLSRVRELEQEIEELKRLLGKQAIALHILERKGTI